MTNPLSTKPTLEQLDTLRHMLGINIPYDAIPQPYRNYAAVSPGDRHYIQLEQLGLIECFQKAGERSSYHYYRCTEYGRDLAIASHKDIRHSRGKRTYRKFLSIAGVVHGLTFKEFLTSPDYQQIREHA